MADTTPNDVRPMSDAPLRFEAAPRKMDLATLFGLIAALALIAVAIFMNGSPLAFVDVPAILMVVLGTFAVTAISYTGEELREAQPSFRQAMFRTEIDPRVADSRWRIPANGEQTLRRPTSVASRPSVTSEPQRMNRSSSPPSLS